MADRRMISKTIYSSYKFLTLSASARDLYTYLILYTDNDGICDAYQVLRLINGNTNDLNTLANLGLIRALNEELLIYIVDFQLFNRLDKRGVPSPHRDLLLAQIPELADVLVEFNPRGSISKQINEKANIPNNGYIQISAE